MSAPDAPVTLLVRPGCDAVSTFPPLGLLALATWLHGRGHDARVLDLVHPEDRAELERSCAAGGAGLIGVTATTSEFPAAVRLVRRLKARWPGRPVVVGGVHVSALRADAVQEAGADFGVLGEGEEPLEELATALAAGAGDGALRAIAGLVFRAADGWQSNPPRGPHPDGDRWPAPDWGLVRAARYVRRPWGMLQRRRGTGFVLTSRGRGRTFRGRSPGLVVDELEALHRDLGVREVLIAEESFTDDPDRAAALCEELLRRELRLAWRTPNGVRADTLDRPLVRLMRRSGCYLLGFEADRPVEGEAGSRAGDLPPAVARAIAWARAEGLMTFGLFTLGRPGDTRVGAERTIRAAIASGLDIAHFSTWVPYPGSPDFERVRSLPGARDWARYVAYEPWATEHLGVAELKRLLRRAYASFYLRPERWRLYRQMLGPAQAWAAARALARYLR